jgi:hypothetical protein
MTSRQETLLWFLRDSPQRPIRRKKLKGNKMAQSKIRRFCKDCDQNRLFEKQKPNHILHLILTVLTVGVWFVIWIPLIVISMFKPFRCGECGKAAY